MNKSAEEWALLNGYKVTDWLGSGDFGEAYLTTCGNVLKITNDQEEFVVAAKIKNANDEHLLKVHKVDVYNNEYIIVMECLDTDGVEDLFSEISILEDGIEVLAYGDVEDYDLSDEASLLFTDLQSCISAYQINQVNPIDIHHDNIGKNSDGHYILFDQKDKFINLEDELNNIQKEKLFHQLKEKKISLHYFVEEFDFTNSKFNDKMSHLIKNVISNIKENYNSLSVLHRNNTYPNILFPDSVDIKFYLTTNPELEYSFDINNNDVLGFQALTTGDGLLGESYYMKENAIILIIDEDKYNELKKNSFLNEKDFLEQYLVTITHELNHVYEFIAHSGGLTPYDVDILNDAGDFDFSVFDCSTGYNLLPLFDGGEITDFDDVIEIMEERVELKGQKMIKELNIQDDIDLFLKKNKKQIIKPHY